MIFLLFSLNIYEYLGIPYSRFAYHMQHMNLEKKTFTCYDGSKEIPLSKFNDHHRDCDDGSDEMGTAEGPEDIPFTCLNHPYIKKNISRSQVNNGVCDCCDGSDENLTVDSDVQCPNTCDQLNKPRYITLNDLKGVVINGLSHRRVLKGGGEKLLNRTNNFLNLYRQQINETQQQIDILKEELQNSGPIPSIYQRHPLITTLWNKIFFIQGDIHFNEVFHGIEGKINYLNYKIDNLKANIDYTKYRYAGILDNNISIEFLPLYNVSFPRGEYDFLFLQEMRKGNVSLGKFKSFDEKNRIIILEDGDYCPEINEGRKTTVRLECWNEGQLFEVNEVSPCVYEARVGTQETCETSDLFNLMDKTFEELLEIKKKNFYK